MTNHSKLSRSGLSLLVLGGLMVAGPARAHISLTAPTPRANMATNQKVGPCGNLPRSATPLQVQAGAQLQVTWTETINHAGWYRLSLRPNDTVDFATVIVKDRIPDVNGQRNYSDTITLPTVPGDLYTLQLVQVMTDELDGTTLSGYGEYFACADLVITAAGDPIEPDPGTEPEPEPEPLEPDDDPPLDDQELDPLPEEEDPSTGTGGCASAGRGSLLALLSLALLRRRLR